MKQKRSSREEKRSIFQPATSNDNRTLSYATDKAINIHNDIHITVQPPEEKEGGCGDCFKSILGVFKG